jgi:inositol oxygenase
MKKLMPFLTVFCALNGQKSDLRTYEDDPSSKVYQCYRAMHTNQTLEYVLQQKKRFLESGSYLLLTVHEALEKLTGYIDESDPDVSFSNHIHNYQTAQACRKLLPDCDWFHLVGLIHDIGKLLYLFDLPTWAIVGDTFPVGHPFSPKCIYYDFFKNNPDFAKPSIYQKHCGFDNVHFSWGHDEYLYQVLKASNTKLPKEAFYLIRYHSFYPFHREYDYLDLASDEDVAMLGYLKLFNACDLYSKVDEIIDYAAIKEYYDALIKKYLPEPLKFFRPGL